MYEADEFGYRVKNKIIYLNKIEKQPEKEEILIIGPIPPFLRNNSNRWERLLCAVSKYYVLSLVLILQFTYIYT